VHLLNPFVDTKSFRGLWFKIVCLNLRKASWRNLLIDFSGVTTEYEAKRFHSFPATWLQVSLQEWSFGSNQLRRSDPRFSVESLFLTWLLMAFLRLLGRIGKKDTVKEPPKFSIRKLISPAKGEKKEKKKLYEQSG